MWLLFFVCSVTLLLTAIFNESYMIMSLAVALLTIFVAMLFISLYYKSKIFPKLNFGIIDVKKNIPYKLAVSFEYRGISHPCVYAVLSDKSKSKIFACKGINKIFFERTSEKCGIAETQIKHFIVKDPMGLFSQKIKIDKAVTVVTFPTLAKGNNFSFSPTELDTAEEITENAGLTKGDEDVRDIREYRQGDRIKKMHRNLSARTSEIWIKEYSSGNTPTITLSTEHNKDCDDTYYEGLFSALQYFLDNGIVIRFYFKKTLYTLKNTEDVYMLIYKLYKNTDKEEKSTPFYISVRGEIRR